MGTEVKKPVMNCTGGDTGCKTGMEELDVEKPTCGKYTVLACDGTTYKMVEVAEALGLPDGGGLLYADESKQESGCNKGGFTYLSDGEGLVYMFKQPYGTYDPYVLPLDGSSPLDLHVGTKVIVFNEGTEGNPPTLSVATYTSELDITALSGFLFVEPTTRSVSGVLPESGGGELSSSDAVITWDSANNKMVTKTYTPPETPTSPQIQIPQPLPTKKSVLVADGGSLSWEEVVDCN